MINLYLRKNVLLLLVLGFVSGTPFLLTLSTLSFWLSENHVSKSLIGLFILVSLPYSFKFLWAPLLDFYTPPLLGRILGPKRAWGLLAQVFLMISIIALGHSDPSQNLMQTAFWAFWVSFFSATQDTIIDTLRIELLKADEVGPGAAMETIGFRLGMMLSGAGALYLAATMTWSMSYTLLSLTVLVGMVVMTMIDEPRKTARLRRDYRSLVRIYVSTWTVLYRKPYFLYLIAFIFCFKMGDTVLNAMISPFLCDLGFTKVEFANVSKFFGISLMVCGGLAGGVIINQIGLWQSVMFCAVLQAISCLLFIIQSIVGHNITILFITVGIESLTSGLAATAFIALLSSFCYAPFSASHFTLLYSLGSLSRVLISSASGFTAEHFGWNTLFALAALSVIPTLYFIYGIKNLRPFEKGIRHEKQHSSS